ncbi:hypothetical protein GCM10023191_040610 [Actinoallomurus oryzae]|uniref:Uncharacterized protein n=1 Tax=Actinoallomurus oryzae TaxID=502180 RepID=A0ABP8Q411_9ACTN
MAGGRIRGRPRRECRWDVMGRVRFPATHGRPGATPGRPGERKGRPAVPGIFAEEIISALNPVGASPVCRSERLERTIFPAVKEEP